MGCNPRSFICALRGIATLLMSQTNARIHGAATIAVIAAALWIGLERWAWGLLILTLVAVWIAEAFNTALEFLADAVAPEIQPLIQHAKDIAAGGVLLAAIGAVAMALILFIFP